MQRRPSLPAARGDFKGKEGKKKGKRKALLSLSLGGGRGGGDGTDGSDTGGSEQARAVLWG